MINIIPYSELGQGEFGWLKARYHFSFSNYYNPSRMGFGKLRVINDDIISAHKGFPPHPHDNMEIITYVRSGAITHEDSQDNKGRTEAGDVQVMSAGRGVTHSEYNLEDEETTLYQIWIEPNKQDVQPQWGQMNFPREPVTDALNLVVSGNKKDNVLFIHQDAQIYAGRIDTGTLIQHSLKKPAYILASEGVVSINGQTLKKGDGAQIDEPINLNIKAIEPSEILIIEVPNS